MTQELIPKGLPDYKEVLAEGRAIADTIQLGESKFKKERGMNVTQWRNAHQKAGQIFFAAQLGTATLDEQVAAQKEVYERCKNRGVDVGINLVTSNWMNGIPPELRDKAPKGTSFVLNGDEDYKRIADASPMQPIFGDHTCMCPNSVNNVISTIKAGCPGIGNFSQVAWKYPYCNDDVEQVIAAVKGLGILSGKVDESDEVQIQGYVGDGASSSFIDHVSELGYALFEQYIAEQLCGVPYKEGLGGLMSHIPNKLATWLAFYEALKENARYKNRNLIYFYEGNTLEVTDDPMSNYGLIIADFLPFAILERKYKTGAPYLAKPVMEAIRVPTPTEIADTILACASALNKVSEFEEVNFINEAEVLKIKDDIIFHGKKFFQNILTKLPELGVDIKNPIHCILAIKRLQGAKLEQLCHPGERDASRYRGLIPYYLNDITQQTFKKAEDMVTALRPTNAADALKGKKIVVCSADTHEFGLMLVDYVYKSFGVEVVNIGVDIDPEQALDAASKAGASYIAVSTHNGQSLAWAARAVDESHKRNQKVKILMGGVLNAIQEGFSEPVDVTEKINALGVFASNDFEVTIKEIAKS